jgi:hypothetical protein
MGSALNAAESSPRGRWAPARPARRGRSAVYSARWVVPNARRGGRPDRPRLPSFRKPPARFGGTPVCRRWCSSLPRSTRLDCSPGECPVARGRDDEVVTSSSAARSPAATPLRFRARDRRAESPPVAQRVPHPCRAGGDRPLLPGQAPRGSGRQRPGVADRLASCEVESRWSREDARRWWEMRSECARIVAAAQLGSD